jgi:hypothetical protein
MDWSFPRKGQAIVPRQWPEVISGANLETWIKHSVRFFQRHPATGGKITKGEDMPHIFKVESYDRRIKLRKASVGDVVYLTANPELPMTVCVKPHYNSGAGTMGMVKARWLKPDGTFEVGEFFAGELTREPRRHRRETERDHD